MKPFDLEAAKRGEPICNPLGVPYLFIGVRTNGAIVVEDTELSIVHSVWPTSMQMAPKKRTVWVNLAHAGYATHWDTQAEADAVAGSGRYRLGGQAYPVEIEE